MMEELKNKLYDQQALTEAETRELFNEILQGRVDEINLSSILTALKIKGETPDEIAGAVLALLDNAAPFPRPDYPFIETAGTGGDGSNTINISTASSIVAAACGMKVAKHGNRSVSSRSGSADLLEALNIPLEMTPDESRRCLDEVGICFLFAPQYHQGVRHAVPVRKSLKTRTLFNILGPLISPARPKIQLMGVYDPELLDAIAKTMQLIGVERAMVVNGSGLDEIAIHGPTKVVEVNGDTLSHYEITPEDLGIDSYSLDSLTGGEPEENARLVTALLKGQGTPAHNAAVAVNAGAMLYLGGIADSLKAGSAMALASIESGQPYQIVERMAEIQA